MSRNFGGVKLFNNFYNFDFRPKPPHASLKNTLFKARMRGFWPNVKIVEVIEKFFAAYQRKIGNFFKM